MEDPKVVAEGRVRRPCKSAT